MILILYSHISNMAAPTLARAGRRETEKRSAIQKGQKAVLGHRKKKEKQRNEAKKKKGRTGNNNLHLLENFRALEKVDFRDCLDLK